MSAGIGRRPGGARFLARSELCRRLAVERVAQQRIVLANGCFELLHVGHLDYLAAARELGDTLVVAINTDDSVRALKGPGRPVVSLEDRAALLCGLRVVDYVLPFPERTLARTLRLVRPDVHAKGSDYTLETVPERELDRELGIEVAICGGAKLTSSSDLITRVRRVSFERPPRGSSGDR